MRENYHNLPPLPGLNFVELSPISFLRRAADTYPHHPGVVYQQRQYTWKQVARQCKKLACALGGLGITTGTTVSMMAAPTPRN